ncbi:Oxalate:formate exchange protein [Hartmannibacter diazotrophicus]|uniref:Oxalate:formate exchange protein n=1 Tax=Hartmannibacter diazotrophicus TaxID=1482074 RepID=A0A2C9D5H4_9HYPH|nr:oxalate/formate MFS antiporter [Hartmannibacter diazotrophicus]SON55388.1 Oxalate:formate exchange protein [Hartmannibacter diazotrophicus]
MSIAADSIAPVSGASQSKERWKYLVLCVIAMVMIANLQYGWSVFVLPLQKATGWQISQIQFAFTLFVALETWGTPLNGWIADRIGPRVVMGMGGLLIAVGWILNAYAGSIWSLYFGSALTGFAAGAVYCTGVGTTVKWFKDNRGLAVGLVAGGFGAGTALTIIPIRMVIENYGYSAAFFWFGLIQGGIVLLISLFVRNPRPGEAPEPKKKDENKIEQTSRSYSPREMLSSRVFWVLYVLDLLMCAGGLAFTAYLAPIAHAYHVADSVVLLGATALSVALVFANVMNGVARPFFGWVSDRIGLWETMSLAFAIGGVSYYLLTVVGQNPYGLIFFTGMIFFCWGEIFSLFPAMCTDLFGSAYATTNTSLLYTAKGAAGFLVPVAALVVGQTGNWNNLLLLAAGINILAVVAVVTVLRPAVIRHHEQEAG